MILKLSQSAEQNRQEAKRVTYRSPCHLKGGISVYNESRQLLEQEGFELVEMIDADACRGFGNGIVLKYPELSNSAMQ